jgi:hypothetical protein
MSDATDDLDGAEPLAPVGRVHQVSGTVSLTSATPQPAPYDPDAILADLNSHPLHVMYAKINIGIRDRGERWAKCANCSSPYQLTEAWSDATVCSGPCFDDYRAYVMGETGL